MPALFVILLWFVVTRLPAIQRIGVRLENGKYPTLRLFAVQIDVDSA